MKGSKWSGKEGLGMKRKEVKEVEERREKDRGGED